MLEQGKRVRRKEQQRQSAMGWLQTPFLIPLRCSGWGGDRRIGTKGMKLSLGRRLCFSPSYSYIYWQLKIFHQAKSVFLVWVIGKRSPYLDPWTFSSYILPLPCWVGGARAARWASGSQIGSTHYSYTKVTDKLELCKCVFLWVLSSPSFLKLPGMVAWANSAGFFVVVVFFLLFFFIYVADCSAFTWSCLPAQPRTVTSSRAEGKEQWRIQQVL